MAEDSRKERTVIRLDDYRRRSNSAREAVLRYFNGLSTLPGEEARVRAGVDDLLVYLWNEGFVIVPLDKKERA
jgi:hypothetical protein